MKKIIMIIALISSFSFGQSWNQIVTTTLNEPTLTKMDLFTNKDGNHLLIRRNNGNIVYYNLNSSGIVNASKTIILETNGDFPNIVGSDDRIFAIYLTGSVIKGKYSTNGGFSWVNITEEIITTGNECNGMDAVFDPQRGVHLVWATRDDNNQNFETYYFKLNPNNNQWEDYAPVTDYPGEVGGQPSVTYSTERVHVSYNTNYFSTPFYGIVKSRDKYQNNWQVPQSVIVGSESSALEKLVARGDSLFIIFAKAYVDPYIAKWDICSKKRSISGTSWSATTLIELNIFQEEIGVAKTFNNYLHTLYKPGSLNHSHYNGYIWSVPVQINDYNIPRYGLSLSSQSNDLYCFWKDGGSSYIKYRQYDSAPLVPKDFVGSVYYTGDNSYPRIQWTLNDEPDVRESSQGYVIWRKVNQGSYSQIATVSGMTSNYIDYGINYAGSGPNVVSYKIKSRDKNNNESGFTNEVSVKWGDAWKIVGDKPLITEFKLFDNYPNPFNPTTVIGYQIPVNGKVSLKIYDVLGKEVATLVEGYKESGKYEIEFPNVETRHASSLPSGIYFYQLKVGQYVQTKKMILAK